MYKRIVCVGDIHGCLEEFKALFDKISYDSSRDRLIICGDLVDRGPFSVETVQFCRQMNFECVLGNHDEKHIRYRKHRLKKEINPQYKFPMKLFFGEKQETQFGLTNEDFGYLESLPLYIELEKDWVVVHAGLEVHEGLEAEKDIAEHSPSVLTHTRYVDEITLKPVSLDENLEPPPGSVYWTELYQGPYNVIYGHNVHWFDSPEVKTVKSGKQTIGIDTGCVFGGSLTCIIFDENYNYTFEHVKAQKIYYDPKTRY